MASTYAHAMGRSPSAQMSLKANATPAWPELGDDLEAFLEARPPAERRIWEDVMLNREILVEGLAKYPQTLLHGDLDDRNIGLGGSNDGLQLESGPCDQDDVVLIDWEWMALGPGALDAANIILRIPVMITPGASAPETIWGDELANYYFKHYRLAGGRCSDPTQWRHLFALATVAQGITQMPFVHGSLRRAIRGDAPLPPIVGIPDEVIRQRLRDGLPIMEMMEERILRAAHTILG
jgi:hypothetical protein